MGRGKDHPKLIHGSVFSPCFMSEEEFENGYKDSIFYVDKDFKKEYESHIAAMEHISNIAKSYILNNWERVKDWSDLEVAVIHGPTGKSTYYYSYKEKIRKKEYGSGMISDFLIKSDRKRKRNQNPVHSISNVVLDPTDGDFSLTINGNNHWWIQDEAVIIIADYIEKQIKNTVPNEEVI
jgi:hypothetical protein